MIAVFREKFISTTCSAKPLAVGDLIIPADVDHEFLTGL
jgi:hypothetical protein